MDFTHLGRTGLTVSRLCLGTMNFGPQTEEPYAHTIMDSAHDHGINFLDTANRYGGPDLYGAHRGDPGPPVRQRRWPAGAYGAGDQALRRDGHQRRA